MFDSPIRLKLDSAPGVSAEIGTDANAFALEFKAQSADDNGHTAPGTHSPTTPRPSALAVAFTHNFNDADVTDAPAGNPDVSNRNSGTCTPYFANANRRPAVNVFPLDTDGVPAGGYPPDC